MTALVTGGNGQLGRALRSLLPTGRFTDFDELDILDREALSEFDWGGTSAIINAAAWTAVDAAEDPAKSLTAWDVNATGVANLAWHARRLDIPLVQISTDYVFRGDTSTPIPVDCALDPQGV
jgi:dTDP-4-dehydrorhamnose reductase